MPWRPAPDILGTEGWRDALAHELPVVIGVGREDVGLAVCVQQLHQKVCKCQRELVPTAT